MRYRQDRLQGGKGGVDEEGGGQVNLKLYICMTVKPFQEGLLVFSPLCLFKTVDN